MNASYCGLTPTTAEIASVCGFGRGPGSQTDAFCPPVGDC